jgi:hypothetical protein
MAVLTVETFDPLLSAPASGIDHDKPDLCFNRELGRDLAAKNNRLDGLTVGSVPEDLRKIA